MLKEDTVKLKNGKWANIGKDGKVDSGTFRTKKQADAQRRAMFSHESLKECALRGGVVRGVFEVETPEGKGEIAVRCKNKTRSILIPGRLRKSLLAYARQSGIASGPVFRTRSGRAMDRSGVWAQMKALCAPARVRKTKVFPHNLRKLFARTFYAVEKDIAKLADILGHSSIDTTRIYIMTSGHEHRRKIDRLGLVV